MTTPGNDQADDTLRQRARASLESLRKGDDPARLVFFSDAVFAIAMTLLVLDLKLPDIAQGEPHALEHALLERYPAFIGFAVSFWIIAGLWHSHHDRFGRLIRYDSILVTINTVLLFVVAFLPLPTALMFTRGTGNSGIGPAIYGLTIGIAYLLIDIEWWYAHRMGFLSNTVSPVSYRRVLLSAVPMIVIFLGSVPVGLLAGAGAAYLTWFVGWFVQMAYGPLLRRWAVRREMERLAAQDAGAGSPWPQSGPKPTGRADSVPSST